MSSTGLRKALLTTAIAVLAGLVVSVPAQADTIFSDFPVYNSTYYAGSIRNGQPLAASFMNTGNVDMILGQISLAVDDISSSFYLPNTNPSITIQVLTPTEFVPNYGSIIPNSAPVLESWTVSNLPTTAGATITVTDTLGLKLVAGNTYWVAVSTSSTSGDVIDWFAGTGEWWNGSNYVRSNSAYADGSAWYNDTGQHSIQVTGTKAPEPASLVLFASGLLTLAGKRKLTRKN